MKIPLKMRCFSKAVSEAKHILRESERREFEVRNALPLPRESEIWKLNYINYLTTVARLGLGLGIWGGKAATEEAL